MRLRLDRFLCEAGLGSRREVHALLRTGAIAVDNLPVRDPGFQLDTDIMRVTHLGTPLLRNVSLHIMLNKPAGVLTAARDSSRQTVMDLLPGHCAALGCMPVGRLDLDTEGLLLLSTDGQLAHRLLSPRLHVEKHYRAVLDAPVDAQDVDAFSCGIPLSDGMALPARLIPEAENAVQVIVTEGRFHQVKRMFQARGKRVLALKRLAFGGVLLDPRLKPGEYRELTEDELSLLKEAVGGLPNG